MAKTKLLVNQMPSFPELCPFSKPVNNGTLCMLNENKSYKTISCTLRSMDGCEYLHPVMCHKVMK